jgi:hypothetical protein
LDRPGGVELGQGLPMALLVQNLSGREVPEVQEYWRRSSEQAWKCRDGSHPRDCEQTITRLAESPPDPLVSPAARVRAPRPHTPWRE